MRAHTHTHVDTTQICRLITAAEVTAGGGGGGGGDAVGVSWMFQMDVREFGDGVG